MKGSSKAGSLGGEKMKPVVGRHGIKSGGANVPNTKPAQNDYGFAPTAKTNVPCSGGKGTGGKL
jgi:hypothetical protein